MKLKQSQSKSSIFFFFLVETDKLDRNFWEMKRPIRPPESSRGLCRRIKLEDKDYLQTYFVKVRVAQSCLTLCDSRDYAVHGILQSRILALVAFPFSRGSSQPRDRTQVSHIAGGFFTNWASREALLWSFHNQDSVVLVKSLIEQQNRKSRNDTHVYVNWFLTKIKREFSGRRIVFSTNGTTIIGNIFFKSEK